MHGLNLDPVPIDDIVESVRKFRYEYGFSHILFSFPSVYDKTESGWTGLDIQATALMSRTSNFQDSVDAVQPLDLRGLKSSDILEFSIERHDAIRLAKLGVLAFYIHKKENPKKRKSRLYISPLLRRLVNRLTFAIVPIPRPWDGVHSSIPIVQAMADVCQNISNDSEEGIGLPQYFWIQPKPSLELDEKHTRWQNPIVREQVLERANYICVSCGNALSLKGGSPINLVNSELTTPVREIRKLSVDHRLPRLLGGSDKPSNYLAMCEDCNSSKGNKLPIGLTIEDINNLDVPQLGSTAILNESTHSKKQSEREITKTEVNQSYHRAIYRCSICVIDIILTAYDETQKAVNVDTVHFGSELPCTLCGTKLLNPEFFTIDD